MIRLLFIDDDEQLLKINDDYFKRHGFKVYTALTESDGLALLNTQDIDCLILDILLSEAADGFSICQKIKEHTNLPVIFLTSLSEQEALYRGFSAGGDDFITKPYDLKELEYRIMARVSSKLFSNEPGAVLSFPPLAIDISRHLVTVKGVPISLTSNEFDILLLLARTPGKPFSLVSIYRNVWRMPDLDSTHTVQVHIGRMRRKLEAACPDHAFISTAWGKGYLFSPPWGDK